MKYFVILFSTASFVLTAFTFNASAGAIDSLSKAIMNSSNDYEKVIAMNTLSRIHRKNNDYKQAMNLANEALNVAKWNDYKDGIIEAYLNLGHTNVYNSNSVQALENYLSVLPYLQKTSGNKITLAKTYINIGLVYNILEKPKEALVYSKKALILLDNTQEYEVLVNCYTNFSDSYLLLEDHQRQIEFLNKCVELRNRNSKQSDLGIEYNKLGSAYWNIKNYDSALKYFNLYLTVSTKTKDTIGLARAYSNLGSVLASKGKYGESLNCYERSLSYQEKELTAHTYIELVEAYCKLNNLKKAIYYFELAKDANANLKDQIEACNYIAEQYQKVSDLEKSVIYLAELNKLREEYHKMSLTEVQSFTEAKYKVEGIQERLAEREMNQLLKENYALQSKHNNLLIVIVALVVLISATVIFFISKKLFEKDKKLQFVQRNVLEMGKYLKDMSSIMSGR